MRKIFSLVLALALTFGGVSFAELQIDEGQARGTSTAISTFFVAKNGGSSIISADRVVRWDTTSNDGYSVSLATTSYDNLVAGVAIDTIQPGLSFDATTTNGPTWGRVRAYGRHANVSFDSGATGCSAGARVGTSGVAGQATTTFPNTSAVSGDTLRQGVSGDTFGYVLEACAAGNKTIDVFINRN